MKGCVYHQRNREQYYPECKGQFEISLVSLKRNGSGHYSSVACDVPAHDEDCPDLRHYSTESSHYARHDAVACLFYDSQRYLDWSGPESDSRLSQYGVDTSYSRVADRCDNGECQYALGCNHGCRSIEQRHESERS